MEQNKDQVGAAVRGEAVALTDGRCDEIAGEVITRIAASKGMHPSELSTDVKGHATLGRELIRAGFSARAADAPDSQPTEPWTCTEDRLPPVETPVFIVHSDDVKIGEIRWEHPSHEETFESFMYWGDPNDDGQSWDWLEVTHWMPIPPAPASSQPTESRRSPECQEMYDACNHCGGSGEVHSLDGEWLGSCDCEASQASSQPTESKGE